ncbi:MAG: tyrosine-type recombinase/integrase [Candidatus Omnitrophica bacterium]|nr:tyrosine-type recombinase/integrase [Candidatus Omnitrophota bacterium]
MTILMAGEKASERFLDFFVATIRNANTRRAYWIATRDFFHWIEDHRLKLEEIKPIHVSVYIEQHPGSPPTVKQHLAALKRLFDWLVTGHVIETNPASPVKGPRHVVKKGKTHVLSSEDTRLLLDSIDTSHVVGLRDRAIIGTMVFSFARVGAVSQLRVRDYYQNGKRWWFRFQEKGGKHHEVPAHHLAEQYVDEYLHEAEIEDDSDGPLFRPSNGKTRRLFRKRLSQKQILKMVKRRCEEAGLPETICSHSFRATGITTFILNGGTLERAQKIACHESPRTTKLYDRTDDSITLDEIERIMI